VYSRSNLHQLSQSYSQQIWTIFIWETFTRTSFTNNWDHKTTMSKRIKPCIITSKVKLWFKTITFGNSTTSKTAIKCLQCHKWDQMSSNKLLCRKLEIKSESYRAKEVLNKKITLETEAPDRRKCSNTHTLSTSRLMRMKILWIKLKILWTPQQATRIASHILAQNKILEVCQKPSVMYSLRNGETYLSI
jgi:hypothetical protein